MYTADVRIDSGPITDVVIPNMSLEWLQPGEAKDLVIPEEAVVPTAPDPKTKYLRKFYPKDGKIHTDENGRQYILTDVYGVLKAFNVTCQALGHAIKKLLCAGIRGKGDKAQDLKESQIAITRAIEMHNEDQE